MQGFGGLAGLWGALGGFAVKKQYPLEITFFFLDNWWKLEPLAATILTKEVVQVIGGGIQNELITTRPSRHPLVG